MGHSENRQSNVLLSHDQILRSAGLFSSLRPYYNFVSLILQSDLEPVDDGDDDGLVMIHCCLVTIRSF